MKIKPVHSSADSDSLPERKEENIVVIGTKSQELSYPSDFCNNAYRIEYSTRSELSRKIEIISFSALVAFMVILECILAVKYGLEHVLQLRKLIMLFVVMGMVGGIMYGLSRLQRLLEECHLTIFKEGIEFSPIWNIELHKRLFRSWEDIHLRTSGWKTLKPGMPSQTSCRLQLDINYKTIDSPFSQPYLPAVKQQYI